MNMISKLKCIILCKCKKRCKCTHCKLRRWLREKISSLMDLIKEMFTEPDLIRGIGLITASFLLWFTGDIKCFLGFLALGWGIFELIV